MQFLDVKTDFAFKKVFGSNGSKDILISLLNAVIDFGDSEKIVDLIIVDPYQIPLIEGMKDSYVDVKAKLSNNKNVIIEMQVLNVEGFEKRVLYNAAKAYSTQLPKGEDFTTLEPIIALTITDFVMFKEIKDIITYFKLIEKKTLITQLWQKPKYSKISFFSIPLSLTDSMTHSMMEQIALSFAFRHISPMVRRRPSRPNLVIA